MQHFKRKEHNRVSCCRPTQHLAARPVDDPDGHGLPTGRHLAIFFVALIQFVLALAKDTPSSRLMAFGRSLGRYQGQIAIFVSFATEEPPFPFSDWPAGDPLDR